MYILNITLNIDDTIHSSCLKWLKSALPAFLAENEMSQEFTMLQVMSEAIQNGSTYTLQFHLPNLEKVPYFEEAYNKTIASGLYSNFQDKVIDFRSTLKKVNWEL